MGSLSPPPDQLTLDFKPTFIPKSIAQFLRQVSRIGSVSDKILKLDDFVSRLESEMRKIDAFKRELPLCMILINDAIVALKEEAMVFKKSSNSEPVLEEFIPLKKSCDEDAKVDMIREEKGGGDNKKNWLSSTQLWNPNTNMDQTQNQKPDSTKKRGVEQDDLVPVGSGQPLTNPARSFIPLKGCFGFTMVGAPIEKDSEELPIPGLSLITPGIGIKNSVRGNNLLAKPSPNTKSTPCFAPNDQPTGAPHGQPLGQPTQQQASRKQRRCWSTELHRRFVNALQQLGGSQAATPKQIRELMQVEGLTNDEVKSHLQKYRLHMRRLPSSNNTSANQTGGGMWMPPQEQSSSPDGPFLTGTTTTTGGDSMDDGEDAKSENYCWKGV